MDLSQIVQQAIDREVDDAWEHLDPADAAFFEQLVRSRAAAAQTAMGWDLWNSAAAFRDAPPLMRTLQSCLACGCTEHHACPEGCWWVTPHLCSSCADEGDLLAATVHRGARPPRLRGPARHHTRTLTCPELHPWAPLCCSMEVL